MPTLRPGKHAAARRPRRGDGAAPLGRLDALQLAGLLRLVERSDELRVSPWRTITHPRSAIRASFADAIEALTTARARARPRLGLVGLTACAGLGACPQGAHRRASRGGASRLERDAVPPRALVRVPAALRPADRGGVSIAAEDDGVLLSVDGFDHAFEDVDAALAGLGDSG